MKFIKQYRPVNEIKVTDEELREKLRIAFNYLFGFSGAKTTVEILECLDNVGYGLKEFGNVFLAYQKEATDRIYQNFYGKIENYDFYQKTTYLSIFFEQNKEDYNIDPNQLSYAIRNIITKLSLHIYANLKGFETNIVLPDKDGEYKFTVYSEGKGIGQLQNTKGRGHFFGSNIIFEADDASLHKKVGKTSQSSNVFFGGRVRLEINQKKLIAYGYSNDFNVGSDLFLLWLLKPMIDQGWTVESNLGTGY